MILRYSTTTPLAVSYFGYFGQQLYEVQAPSTPTRRVLCRTVVWC